jgi:ubiquinone/menaquinone biosynthesis C-methylase UbiE
VFLTVKYLLDVLEAFQERRRILGRIDLWREWNLQQSVLEHSISCIVMLLRRSSTRLVVLSLFVPSRAFFFRFNPHKTLGSNTCIIRNMSGDNNEWSAQADLYSSQATRLTELHGADLVTILKDDIIKAKTILDVGCGTGAFAKAYLQQFPKGVPGQTLIRSDLSAGMLEKAKETVQPTSECQTKIVFQEEDGTKLEGIPDNSIDLVVSLFGVFLIPDQESALKAIQRALTVGKENVFANGSWQFDVSEYLTSQGFGVSLQDAFRIPSQVIRPDHKNDAAVIKWANKKDIETMFSDNAESVDQYQAIHTPVWEFEALWTMIAKNPMSAIQGASDSHVENAKNALGTFVTKDGSLLERPLMLSTVSILCVVKGFSADK